MGSRSPIERFLDKVEKTETCWLWLGWKKPKGSGQFKVGERKVLVHRWSYEHFVGPIPEGFRIVHLCGEPSCVNPEHLEAVTLQESRDRRKRPTHCPAGHPFTPENTRMQRGSSGCLTRICRTCERARSRARYYASRAAAGPGA